MGDRLRPGTYECSLRTWIEVLNLRQSQEAIAMREYARVLDELRASNRVVFEAVLDNDAGVYMAQQHRGQVLGWQLSELSKECGEAANAAAVAMQECRRFAALVCLDGEEDEQS